ncbi:Hypothetical predicted protein [Olea europaea subsp. europaea]|uniref:Uncharacterized protein n=1 Tax=Olea europaea subsp. europaea TaxID=158383 RepID=A0A8S0SIT9_OLEEU|nr:Hypothetical predicted protein [Olea europaea subsp. europaea]
MQPIKTTTHHHQHHLRFKVASTKSLPNKTIITTTQNTITTIAGSQSPAQKPHSNHQIHHTNTITTTGRPQHRYQTNTTTTTAPSPPQRSPQHRHHTNTTTTTKSSLHKHYHHRAAHSIITTQTLPQHQPLHRT